jgi:RNA polymerase sigma-70 factor (ECF subfamily)
VTDTLAPGPWLGSAVGRTVDAVNQDPLGWERAMMARIRVGDDSALAAIYDQYAPLVHGIARQLVGPDADDVCQEVFVSLWQHPDGFDAERGSLRTYLAMSTRRRSVDLLRSTGRRRARERAVVERTPSTPPNVDEAAMALIAAERVRHALERLPSEQRRALELAYLDGLTFQRVAEAMGTPEGTAKSRLRLGLGRLARELSGTPGMGAPEWA